MGDRANLAKALGPCNVYFEELGADVDVGYLGTVTVNIATESAPLTASQKGTSPVDGIVTGGKVTVTIEFAELTFENFARVYPGATVTGDGDRVDFLLSVGTSLRSLAKQVTLKKIVGGDESTDPADWLIFPELSPDAGEISLAFDAETQRRIVGNFTAWPGDADNRFCYFGDELAS